MLSEDENKILEYINLMRELEGKPPCPEKYCLLILHGMHESYITA